MKTKNYLFSVLKFDSFFSNLEMTGCGYATRNEETTSFLCRQENYPVLHQ
ncbi:hypothetical protein HYX11_03050 [Candidatus Woesearchaeota archaeon]|nr:hypothetical protein [Candidatus Woesearchaeota archaeon]